MTRSRMVRLALGAALLVALLCPVAAHSEQVSIQPIRMPALYIPYIAQSAQP